MNNLNLARARARALFKLAQTHLQWITSSLSSFRSPKPPASSSSDTESALLSLYVIAGEVMENGVPDPEGRKFRFTSSGHAPPPPQWTRFVPIRFSRSCCAGVTSRRGILPTSTLMWSEFSSDISRWWCDVFSLSDHVRLHVTNGVGSEHFSFWMHWGRYSALH